MALGIEFSTVVPAAGYCWVPLDEYMDRLKAKSKKRAIVPRIRKPLSGPMAQILQKQVEELERFEQETRRLSDESLKRLLGGTIRPVWNIAGGTTPQLLLLPADDGRIANGVKPLDLDSGLFRNFGNIDPTPQGVLEFANTYGRLFGHPFDDSEPFGEWEFEIRSMRFLVSVWDAVVSGRRTAVIEQHFTTEIGGGAIAYPFADDICEYHMFRNSGSTRTPPEEVLAALNVSWDCRALGATGKPLEVARQYLTMALNRRLESCRVTTALSRDGKLTLRPPMLLGAIWSQFAVAVSEAKQHRACEICGTYFELDPELNRTSRFYCSDACRVKMHRNRKAKAQRLHAAGKTLKQIAAAMDSDVTTIRKWLKPRGE